MFHKIFLHGKAMCVGIGDNAIFKILQYYYPMRIGIDFDEVVADSAAAIIALHNKQYATNYKKEDITSYHVEDVWGGTKEEWEAKLDEFFSAKNVQYLDPIAGSIPAMDSLKKAGHELYIITARGDSDIEATELWLKLHFPDTFNGVHYGHARLNDPEKTRSKPQMCKELGIKLMIDDHLSNAKQCADEGIKVFLFDQPWNQRELPEGVERVRTWEEIVKKLS
jgi:hypothetical protein